MRKTGFLIAAGLCMLMAMPASAGWNQVDDGRWQYLDSHNNVEYNKWEKDSVGRWYWIGDDGFMVTDTMVEDNGEYYYLNEYGTMVTNEWKLIYDEEDDRDYWHFFGPNGKAYRMGSKVRIKEINSKKYIFDEEGRMLSGWITEDGEQVDEDEDTEGWMDAIYYTGEDGAVRTGWQTIVVGYDEYKDDDDEEENVTKSKKFYFNESNGKKYADVEKTMTDENGKKYKYSFGEDGAVVTSKFITTTKTTTDSTGKKTTTKTTKGYNNKGQQYKAEWIEKVPSSSQNAVAHEDDIKVWFYSQKNGNLAKNQILKINSNKYLFDAQGVMVSGLVAVKDGKFAYLINHKDEIEYLPGSPYGEFEDVMKAVDDGYDIYYFQESNGRMKTGTTTITLEDEKYSFLFDKDGKGHTGVKNNKLYKGGVLLKADDKEAQYIVNGVTYTVNTSGKVIS